jgi:hypothetical protein
LVFGASGKIFIMIVKQSRDDVEGEEVALPMERRREWRQNYTFFGSATVWSRWSKKDKGGDVLGRTPNTAVGRSEQHKSGPLSGLPTLPNDSDFRAFASIGSRSRFYAPFLDISASAYVSR